MDIASFLETLPPADRGKVIVFHNAVVKCTRAYQEDPTEIKLRNLRAAEQALAVEVERVQPTEAVQNEVDDDQIDIFDNRLDAWQYLQDSGWQIGRSQFYEHCKQGRVPRRDGKYRRDDVDRYAQHHCRLAETGEKVDKKRSRIADEKAEIELAREKARLEKDLHDLAVRKGEYVERDQVELMIVGRAIAMLAHLKAMVQMGAADWIELVEGRQDRGQELIATLIRSIEGHLATFARDVEFDVILERNVDGNEQAIDP